MEDVLGPLRDVVPQPLSDVVLSALSMNPNERPADAGALLAALNAAQVAVKAEAKARAEAEAEAKQRAETEAEAKRESERRSAESILEEAAAATGRLEELRRQAQAKDHAKATRTDEKSTSAESPGVPPGPSTGGPKPGLLGRRYIKRLGAVAAAAGVVWALSGFFGPGQFTGGADFNGPADGVEAKQEISTQVGNVKRAILEKSDSYRSALNSSGYGTQPKLVRTYVGHKDRVASAAFGPSGRSVISGGYDHRVVLWDVESGEIRKDHREHQGSVYAVAFGPDGKWAASGGQDESIIIWDVAGGDGSLRTLRGHGSPVWSIATSPDGSTIMSGGKRSVIFWDVHTGEKKRESSEHTDWVGVVGFSPSGDMALSGGHDRSIALWDVKSGLIRHKLTGHDDWVRGAVFTRDGQSVVTVSEDGTMRFWDVGKGSLIGYFLGHESRIWSVAVSSDGLWALSGDHDGIIGLWDIGTRTMIWKFRGHNKWIKAVAFSPDGKTGLSASGDTKLILWDLAGHEPKSEQGASAGASLNDPVPGSAEKKIRAWHILIKLAEGASQAQEEQAMAELGRAQEALKTTPFFEVARTYSRVSGIADGGDLGFFARGTMAKPFEEVAFDLAVNEVSKPVRTRYGFHLIQRVK